SLNRIARRRGGVFPSRPVPFLDPQESMSPTSPVPERIDLSRADQPRDVVHRAVACLAQGGIIAVATESVHGLSASALRPGAVARLRQIQGLESSCPLTLLLGEPGEG